MLPSCPTVNLQQFHACAGSYAVAITYTLTNGSVFGAASSISASGSVQQKGSCLSLPCTLGLLYSRHQSCSLGLLYPCVFVRWSTIMLAFLQYLLWMLHEPCYTVSCTSYDMSGRPTGYLLWLSICLTPCCG